MFRRMVTTATTGVRRHLGERSGVRRRARRFAAEERLLLRPDVMGGRWKFVGSLEVRFESGDSLARGSM